jgi:hypothetical protein
MFFALQLDRGNILQALTDNMLSKFILNYLLISKPCECIKLTRYRGPTHDHESVQLWSDDILPMFSVCRAPIADDFQEARS